MNLLLIPNFNQSTIYNFYICFSIFSILSIYIIEKVRINIKNAKDNKQYNLIIIFTSFIMMIFWLNAIIDALMTAELKITDLKMAVFSFINFTIWCVFFYYKIKNTYTTQINYSEMPLLKK
jgi:hypothetical protein